MNGPGSELASVWTPILWGVWPSMQPPLSFLPPRQPFPSHHCPSLGPHWPFQPLTAPQEWAPHCPSPAPTAPLDPGSLRAQPYP